MSLPKKGTRTIIVNEHRYHWKVIPSVSILLIVESDEYKGQLLQANFDYVSLGTVKEVKVGDKITYRGENFIITPGIVQETITYALENGWKPTERGGKFGIGNLTEKLILPKIKN